MEAKKTYKILTILLIMQWAFIGIISQYPSVIEKYYSNGLYIYISKFLRLLFGWIPFSVGDIFYFLIIIIFIRFIYFAIKYKKVQLKSSFFKFGAFISIVFFLFHINWGLNYFRQPLYKTLHFEKNSYTSNELLDFTKKLIVKTNEAQIAITKNDTIVVENPSNKWKIKEFSPIAYNQLQVKYPQFKFEKTSVKHSLFSLPLTYMGFAGYLNPITNEAQVNSLIPKNSYPTTVCYELAHQIGIASESEASFLGYLASVNSNNAYFNYSGYLLALRFCLSDIYQTDPEIFDVLKETINKGVLKDIQQNQDFWDSYQNWSEKYFKFFYDNFLKANKQKEGMREYNKLVSLLVNYHKKEKL